MAHKTNQAFKLSQSTKRMMATLPKGVRNEYKKTMIDAQVTEQVNKMRRKDREDTSDSTEG